MEAPPQPLEPLLRPTLAPKISADLSHSPSRLSLLFEGLVTWLLKIDVQKANFCPKSKFSISCMAYISHKRYISSDFMSRNGEMFPSGCAI